MNAELVAMGCVQVDISRTGIVSFMMVAEDEEADGNIN